MRNFSSRFTVHDKTIVSMIVGYAGNMSVIKMGTVLEIVEYAHVTMPVFFSRLPKFGLKNEILDLDSIDQRDIQGGTNLVLVLALTEMLDEANALFFSPFPHPLVGCDKLIKQFLRFKVLFVNEFLILGNGGCRFVAIRIKSTGSS